MSIDKQRPKRCANCAKKLNSETTGIVRVVEVTRTDNHYAEVCEACANTLCNVDRTHRRIDQQQGLTDE